MVYWLIKLIVKFNFLCFLESNVIIFKFIKKVVKFVFFFYV